MKDAAIYKGLVWHARYKPRHHSFRYRLFMVWLNLDRLDEAFGGTWLWSHRFPTLAWFRRRDHIGDPAVPLGNYIRSEINRQTGQFPAGPIYVLTHLRYFGYYMNPITLYYCHDESGQHVAHVVAEVHNTPWNERHLYLWPGEVCRDPESMFRCAKTFHVSPFMDMDQVYRCRLNEPGDKLSVHLENEREGEAIFGAGMEMARTPWHAANRTWTLMSYPFMTLRVFVAIYAQALRLWWKGVPLHSHPRHHEPLEEQGTP